MEKIIRVCGQSCFDGLAEIAGLNRINNILPKELTGRTDDMILNVSYLLNNGKVDDFLESVRKSTEKYKNTGLQVEATGPWPSFSFVNIKEK